MGQVEFALAHAPSLAVTNFKRRPASTGFRGDPAVTPNPSIEGMPKRLRLLRTPHVKR